MIRFIIRGIFRWVIDAREGLWIFGRFISVAISGFLW